MKLQRLFYLGALTFMNFMSISQAGTLGNQVVCSAASDCDETKGLVQCAKDYDSCSKGRCTCAANKVYSSGDNMCIMNDDSALIGQPCVKTTSIPNSACTTKVVTCNQGTTNVGSVLCRDSKTKLLGEACNTTANEICYSYIAGKYASARRQTCSRNVCGCNSGSIWQGTNCRDRMKGDMCAKSSDCPTYQSCVYGYCGCLSTQKQYRYNDVLVCYSQGDYGTAFERTNCTNQNECAIGLICGRCPEHTYNTCRKLPPSAGSHMEPIVSITLLWAVALQGSRWLL